MSIIGDILDIDDIRPSNDSPSIDLIDTFSKQLDFLPSPTFLNASGHTILYTHHIR